MAGLFHASRTKVARGRKHIAETRQAFESALADHHRFLQVHSLMTGDNFSPEFEIPESKLDEAACCVGDAVHNLRAALDLLACEAVERSGQSPKDVHFPFAQTASELTSPGGGMIQRKKFNRARSDAQTLLLALEPHGEPHGNALLWALHRLDLTDKHRDLLAVAAPLAKPGAYIGGAHFKPNDYESPKLVLTGDILPGKEVLTVLDGLAGEVERTIEAFRNLGW